MEKSLLGQLLPKKIMLLYFDEIGSTNSHAKMLARQGGLGEATLVAAARQTAGRGRRGRDFYSPAGGIYMSYVFRHGLPPHALSLITPAAAVAVRNAIKKICRIDCGIKWVNDIELGGKKVCGILTELEGEHCIVGIGVNWLSGDAMPCQLAQTAACIFSSPPEARPEALAAEIIDQLAALLAGLPENTAFLEDYSCHSTLLGRAVTVHTSAGSYTATAVGIDSAGRLIVRTDAGDSVTLQSGEVSVRRRA